MSIPLTPAPKTPWNANVSPNRRFAMKSVLLDDIKRLKELEEENQQLKRMFADLSLKHEVLKDIVKKKL